MRRFMLFMSLICLTALAAGCEDNNMVVLMCDGGACPDGGGRTESEVQNPPQSGENDPDLGSQDPTNPGPGTQDPTQPVKPDPVNPEDPGDPTQSGPEAQDPTQPENPEPTDPGPCVGACNPTDPSNPEPGDPIAPSDGPGTGKSGDTCEVDADCDIKDNLVCQNGVCDVKENGPKPKCEEGNACVGCECLAPMECKDGVCINREEIKNEENCSHQQNGNYRCNNGEVQICEGGGWNLVLEKCTDKGYHYCGNGKYEFVQCSSKNYCVLLNNESADCVYIDLIKEGERCILPNNSRCTEDGKNILRCKYDGMSGFVWEKEKCRSDTFCYMYEANDAVGTVYYQSYCK